MLSSRKLAALLLSSLLTLPLQACGTLTFEPTKADASILEDVPRVKVSASDTCPTQKMAAEQNSYLDAAQKIGKPPYKAACDLAPPKPATKPIAPVASLMP